MNKFIILSILLILGFASCARTNLEKLCKDFTIEEYTLHASCRTNSTWDSFTLDLNTCLTIKRGLLNYPGTNLRDYCDRCYLRDTFNLYCSCWKITEPRTEDSDLPREERRRSDLLLSYMNMRDFIAFENGMLHC
jgi:hypothetical protein